MRNETIISKGKYHHPQPEQLITVKQYLFTRSERGTKQVMLRLVNDRPEPCTGFAFVLCQMDARGNVLGEERYESQGKSYKSGKTFSPDKVFEVKEKCTDIRVKLLYANFGDYTYRVESAGVNVVYEKAKRMQSELVGVRHGHRKVRPRVVRKPWTFLVLALILLSVSFVAFIFMLRAYVDTHDVFSLSGVQYEFVNPDDKDGAVIVTGYDGLLGNMLIPAEIEGHPVVGIKEDAFVGNRLLRQVRIEGIDVPAKAFYACKNLRDVQLIDVDTVGAEAFFNCDSLEVVSAEGTTVLGNNVFADCSALRSVRFSHEDETAMLSLGENAFALCESLTSVSIEQMILYPEDQAIFRGAYRLRELHLCNFAYTVSGMEALGKGGTKISALFGSTDTQLPFLTSFSVDYIDELAEGFASGLVGLESVTIAKSEITQIPAYAFSGCLALSALNLKGSVQSVGECAFYATALKSFDGSALVSIGNSAFENCTALTGVNISATGPLVSVGRRAFAGCASLRSIALPAGVTELRTETFAQCYALESVTFATPAEGEGITKIPDACFLDCISLESVTLPAGVSVIGDAAFMGCVSLGTVQMERSPEYFGLSSFEGCAALSGMRIDENTDYIGDFAFADSGITELIIPVTVEYIGFGALKGCVELTELTLPYLGPEEQTAASNKRLSYLFGAESATAEDAVPRSLVAVTLTQPISKLENYAFYACPGLERVTLPELTVIGNYAFAGCDSLATFDLSEIEQLGSYAFSRSGLVCLSVPEGWTVIPAGAFQGCAALREITLPTTLNEISKNAFSECTALAQLSCPAALSRIGEGAFSMCTALTRVELPAVMSKIGSRAFASSAVQVVTMPETLETLDSYAFSGCNSLTEITLPRTMQTVGEGAFSECARLRHVALPATLSSLASDAFRNCTSLASVQMPTALTHMGDSVFSGCSSLGEIVIPEGLAVLGAYTFSGCTHLSNVTLPASLRNINENAFARCTMLTAISLPNGLSLIGSGAFASSGLAEVTVPTSVSQIGSGAFAGCRSLREMTLPFVSGSASSGEPFGYVFGGENGSIPTALRRVCITSADTMTIPAYAFANCARLEQVTLNIQGGSIGAHAFANCGAITSFDFSNVGGYIGDSAFSATGLTALVLPSSITSIDSGAFSHCESLQSVTFPSTSISVSSWAFLDCEALRSTNLGASKVTTLGEGAFQNCAALSEIVLPTTLTYIGSRAFYGTPIRSIVIPTSVQIIGGGVFGECDSLAEITVPFVGYSATNGNTLGYFFDSENEELPATLKKVRVNASDATAIPYGAFSYTKYVEEVFLSGNVTSIQGGSFVSAARLFYLSVPSALRSVSYDAFNNTYRLYEIDDAGSSVTMGNYVSSVIESRRGTGNSRSPVVQSGDYRYARYNGTWYLIDFNASATTLAPAATFAYNGGTVTTWKIPKYLCYGNNTLVKLQLPVGMSEIGEYAFYHCGRLETAELPNGAASIGAYAFFECYALDRVNMGTNLSTIGAYAFAYCNELDTVKLSPQLSSVGDCAFLGCSSLYDVYYNGTLPIRAGSKTYGLVARNAVTVHTDYNATPSVSLTLNGMNVRRAGSEWLVLGYSGNAETLDFTTLTYNGQRISSIRVAENAFGYNTSLKALITGNETKQIQAGAFARCANLRTVTLGGSALAEIEERTFQDCAKLERVTITDTVRTIGDYAFAGCLAMREIKMPASLTQIGGYAFQSDRRLLSVVIPSGVTSIGTYAFEGCVQLFEVYDLSGTINVSKGSSSYGYVGYYAKQIFTSPYSQTAGNRLLRVEREGFTFVQADGKYYLYLYENTDAKQFVTIPRVGNSCVILAHAFDGQGVVRVRIPDTVTELPYSAFDSSLREIYFEGNRAAFNNIGSVPSGVTLYCREYASCVHGPNQWAEVNGEIVTAPFELNWTETPATCDKTGQRVGTCQACSYTETQQILALGHAVENDICTRCGKTCVAVNAENFNSLEIFTTVNSFAVSNNRITSTNKADSSTSKLVITAKVAMSVSFDYGVSSEANFDKFAITPPTGQSGMVISGEQTGNMTVYLAAGETLTFSYTKDSSVNSRKDCGYLENLYLIY